MDHNIKGEYNISSITHRAMSIANEIGSDFHKFISKYTKDELESCIGGRTLLFIHKIWESDGKILRNGLVQIDSIDALVVTMEEDHVQSHKPTSSPMEARLMQIGSVFVGGKRARMLYDAIPIDYHPKLNKIHETGMVTGFPRDYMMGRMKLETFLSFLNSI
jgi:hypothetical protein